MNQDDVPWLHVYGQFSYHTEALIRGNRMALLALRDAIDAALTGTEGSAEVFAGDGEGYGLKVHRVNTMAALGRPEYIWERDHMFRTEEAERDRVIKRKATP